MNSSIRLPARASSWMQDHARGTVVPVEPRDAATVVLLRAGATAAAGQLQVHLLRRQKSMAFASGMAVFPGGGVDPGDFAAGLPVAGPSMAHWAELLGVAEQQARALLCAAARETFEECGVLFAGDVDGNIVADTSDDGWEEDRRRVTAHEITLADLLRQRKLTLRTDLLRAWSVWTTPTFETRRYRTWFFVAQLPHGQYTRDVSTEAESVEWISLRDVLVRASGGERLMLPPQHSTCLELFGYRSADELFGAEHELYSVEPRVELDDAGAYLVLPERFAELARTVRARL